MQSYAVEVYTPRAKSGDVRDAAERLRRAAAALRREGTPISYRRSLFLPGDETCFHVFDAGSSVVVAEAARRAYVDAARVVEAVQ